MQELPTFRSDKISAPKVPDMYKTNFSATFSTNNKANSFTGGPASGYQLFYDNPTGTFPMPQSPPDKQATVNQYEINFPPFVSYYYAQKQANSNEQFLGTKIEMKPAKFDYNSALSNNQMHYKTFKPDNIAYNVIKTANPKSSETNQPFPLVSTTVYGSLGSYPDFISQFNSETNKQQYFVAKSYTTEEVTNKKKPDLPKF